MGPAGAIFVGFLMTALVHAVVLGARLGGGAAVWWSAQYVAGAQLLGLGVACAVGVGWLGALPSRWARVGWLAVGAAAGVLLRFGLAEDAKGLAERAAGWVPEVAVYWGIGAGGVLLWTGAFAFGRGLGALASSRAGLARGALRWVGAVGALCLGAMNAVVLPLSYPGLHAVAAVAAALVIGGAAVGMPLGGRWRRLTGAWGRRWLRVAGVGMGVLAVLPAFVMAPSNAVLIELLRQPAGILVPFLARAHAAEEGDQRVPIAQREWFIDRTELPAILPSRPPVLKDLELVLLVGVDSMRADLLEDEKHRARLPELFRLRDEGIWFRNARSPGSSTAPSLAALFSGVYYSQLYWTTHERRKPEVFPHEDPTPRFPELLARAGVTSETVDTAGWLLNEFGIVRGFSEQQSARKGRGYPSARGGSDPEPAGKLG